jgi:hypothetical protein
MRDAALQLTGTGIHTYLAQLDEHVREAVFTPHMLALLRDAIMAP